MNTGQIIKSKTTERFTTLPNELIKSKSLTLEEKGFLSYLLSLPSDWVLYRKNLYDSLPDSPGTIDRIFKSLQVKGYILSVKMHNNEGRFAGWNHIVYDIPSQKADDRDDETPRTVNADVGETPPIQKTEYTNTVIQNTEYRQSRIPDSPFTDSASNEFWVQWIRYRAEIKKKLTISTAMLQIDKLNKFTAEKRIEIIKQSISNGWTGLFDIKENKQNSSHTKVHSNGNYKV